ncbi:MAG: hypothetical protein LC800_17875 [Acidobacteria bacterium]|nr:hypothetical protein [Acidobacteriota bacterium]
MKLKAFPQTLIAILLVLSVSAQARPRTARRPHTKPAAAHVRAGDTEGAAARAPATQTLPIRRVTLYSNGVAYIERRGTVTGHAEIALSFKQSQVDDVLKSMVVLDLGQGRIGAVSYNSSAPPAARMADIPFSVGAVTQGGGLAGILTQLQGARVLVTTKQNRAAAGSILTVEQRQAQPDKERPATTTHALVISSEGGELMSFDLADVRSVKLLDDGARRDVTEFASASASARRRDAKTIVVTSDGAGAREMVVSYTIAAPIWKTTYRVVLDASGKPFFQGWAIVDNVSEEDWTDVQLSLISGTPISFILPIQQPFYRYRPVIPRPADLQLEPQVHDPNEGEGMSSAGGGVGISREKNETANNFAADGIQSSRSAVARRYDSRQMLQLPQQNSVDNLAMLSPGAAPAPSVSLSEAITGGDSGVEAAAEGAEVGDLFEYQIAQPVTVRRDRSALIPIVQTRMEGARVSIYNQAARSDRPLSGMLLRNTSGLTLEDGALTVIDGNSYAGEALMERLKPQEQRLISFALDLGTLASVRQVGDRAPASLLRIKDGVFQVHFHQEDKKIYTLVNQTDRPRVVYVEHPVRAGWELTKDTRPPEGKSARYYRFRVELKPHEKAELPVAERRALMETYSLSDFTRPQLDLFFSRRYVDEATRATIQGLIDLKTQIAALDSRRAAIDREIQEIGEDQKRLRENIEALTKTAEARQLITRYISKADQQETRIEVLTQEKQTVAAERARLQSQLDTAVRALIIERNLAE